MNYGDRNFIKITQQTKLRVAFVVSSESSRAVRQARYSQNALARHVERRSTRSTKSKVSSCVETSKVEFGPYRSSTGPTIGAQLGSLVFGLPNT